MITDDDEYKEFQTLRLFTETEMSLGHLFVQWQCEVTVIEGLIFFISLCDSILIKVQNSILKIEQENHAFVKDIFSVMSINSNHLFKFI